MTAFWLFLSDVFKWTFQIFDFAGNAINWILFFTACGMFCYWCFVLVSKLGNNKDKDYFSQTEGKNPYYDPKIYKTK
jgi:pyruvate-formate lyase-activating enzyme